MSAAVFLDIVPCIVKHGEICVLEKLGALEGVVRKKSVLPGVLQGHAGLSLHHKPVPASIVFVVKVQFVDLRQSKRLYPSEFVPNTFGKTRTSLRVSYSDP